MKKYLPWIAVPLLLIVLIYAQHTHKTDQQLLQDSYQALLPSAAKFKPLNDSIAAAQDASGSTLAYVGVSSAVGYGGPMLVGVLVHTDGTLGTPVIFTHRETPAYLSKIEQHGFFQQFESRRVDDALTPGFDINGVSGATLSSRAVASAVNEAAHAIAVHAMELAPQKAELPWQIGVNELALAALFALGLLASTVKKLARFRLILLGGSILILGFWLNRSFSLAFVLAACMGFFPHLAQNLGWYIVIAGALLAPVILGKNTYCAFVCPFCGLQELTHKISNVNLSTGPLMKVMRSLRSVFLFAALFIGFLSLNPSCASYEPFGTIFGLNGENCNWYLLFFMLVASFFFHRFWCHLFCPAGALLDFIAARRREVGKLCCKAGCRSGKSCTSEAGISGIGSKSAPFSSRHLRDTGNRGVPLSGTPNMRPTKSQVLFLLFYAAGVFCIVWTVWNNVNAQ